MAQEKSWINSQSDRDVAKSTEKLQKQISKPEKSESSTPFIPNNFNVGLSSMKKGFSNLMTSIDSALKPSPEDGSSDTASMRSDVSSDSENYVIVSLENQERIDAVFALENPIRITSVEEASEVVEETPDTQSEKSLDSSCKRKDIVSLYIALASSKTQLNLLNYH